MPIFPTIGLLAIAVTTNLYGNGTIAVECPLACKRRKSRCSRDLPRCSRCESSGLQCSYPERRKRRKKQPATENTFRPILLKNESSPSTIHAQLEIAVAMTPCSTTSRTALAPQTFMTATASDVPRISAVDPMRTLEDAMDQVKELKQDYYLKSVVSDYFLQEPTDMFQSLINRDLIEAIPDVIDSPQIHLDPVSYILYYAILYLGCSFCVSSSDARQGFEFASSCYLACLRVLALWQPQADNSPTDFVAALFMVRIAMLGCDHDLAWRMHRYACDAARRLNLHNIDGGDYTGLQDIGRSDEGRRGFWQMIQIDLHVRLIFDKPATITADTFNVNLPWLSATSEPLPAGTVQTTTFLINSQMAMILFRFFALVDAAGGKGIEGIEELTRQTENLCHDIKDILSNWRAEEWIRVPSARKIDDCYKSDILLAAYTYTIFMLRKVDSLRRESDPSPSPRSSSPFSPLTLDASRRVVELLNHMVRMYPYPEGLSCTLGYYRADIALGVLYSHVRSTQGTQDTAGDTRRLWDLARDIRAIPQSRELAPFARAVEALDRILVV
ncbi:Zn(II)2Cys6 transcription factor [Aspergillus stella-maris]|uniref:Zn(II)2Cys6 transcription factor n=1 Tax=Aspergillus stella-maris TaxID=1810926 RepID=UPI003CCDC45F